MILTGIDMALEAAARMVANCTDGTVTSVSVSTGATEAAEVLACTRAAEALAVRLGVSVAAVGAGTGLSMRFTPLSVGRRERNVVRSSAPRR